MASSASFMTMDQFWSIFTMPIGLIICFGPVLAVWLLSGPNQADDHDHPRR